MSELIEYKIISDQGSTYYWVSDTKSDVTLVFLPGLTADHRLFDQQISFFKDKYKVLVWDCPCHGLSRPYKDFSYKNVSNELDTIIEKEDINKAVFIGQSLGGMIAQYYINEHKEKTVGFISIDSVPFGDYYSKSDMFWLKQLEWMCNLFPDKLLRTSMAKMCGVKENTIHNMLEMLSSYDKKELCHLMYIGEASFIPENKNIELPCKCILLLGDKDKTGKVSTYNKEWAKRTGYPLIIIKDAAHNSNVDQPDIVNTIINDFIESI